MFPLFFTSVSTPTLDTSHKPRHKYAVENEKNKNLVDFWREKIKIQMVEEGQKIDYEITTSLFSR
jgi:hypothetical protein